MVPSLHDNILTCYAVDCERRTIALTARSPVQEEQRIVTFSGVHGYHFKDDAFGNIIFALAPISIAAFLQDYGAEISQSYKAAGSPGPWAGDLATANAYLTNAGVSAYVISATYGLSGWLLATSFEVTAGEQKRG